MVTWGKNTVRLFPKELDVPLDEGFTPSKDIFNRKPFGDQLTSIIMSVEAPLVMILDAPWGAGKTTFVRMWAGELHKTGIPRIYFDAFSNDYQSDAFIALSSCVIGEIRRLTPPNSGIAEGFSSKALKVAKVLGKAGFRVAVKAATAGLVEAESLESAASEIVGAVGEEATKAFDDALQERLGGHESDRQSFAAFRDSLKELSELLARRDETGNVAARGSAPPRLVFIIDELDRCKPSFALSIVETIKHFFSVEGIYFVLITSLSQLEWATKLAYGNINAKTYLEKFYHLRLLFPSGNAAAIDKRIAAFARHLGCSGDVIDILEQYSRFDDLSLRRLERITTYFKLSTASIPEGGLNINLFSIPLCILKVVHPEQYDLMRQSRLTFDGLNKCLGFDQWRDPLRLDTTSALSGRISSLWRFILGDSEDDLRGGSFLASLPQYGVERHSLVPYFCNLIDGLRFPNSGRPP